MSKSKSHEILGAVKTIRAVKDLVYQGKEYRGRRRERIDGQEGSYDIVTTPGEEFQCDQDFARAALDKGEAEYVAGGLCDVIAESDGMNRYTPWNKSFWLPQNETDAYDCVEVLRDVGFCGLSFPAKFKCRLDRRQFDRTTYVYQNEPEQYGTLFRVLKPSPQKIKATAAEQSTMVAQLMAKVFPAQTV